MKYLEDLGINEELIDELEENTPEKLLELLKNNEKLVSANINFLKELGIEKYPEVLIRFPDMFLMDNSNFKDVFAKYEVNDLIEKINKNVGIVEFL